jgi:GNAT superfamily N-acetyltransferase
MVERACVGDWVRGIAHQPGNPLRASTQEFGAAEATICGASRIEVINRVFGFDDSCLDVLPEILGAYAAASVSPVFDISPNITAPYWKVPNALHELARNGLYQAGFHQQLYLDLQGSRSAVSAPAHDIRVWEAGPEDLETFRTLYAALWGDPAVGEPWLDTPSFHCFIASVAGEPAGLGILHVRDGAASFVNAMTLPSMRGRGVQSALIQARIDRAVAEGCDVLVSQCRPGSVSERNQIRAGFVLACTKVWWMPMSIGHSQPT